jgi:hypothetical protein
MDFRLNKFYQEIASFLDTIVPDMSYRSPFDRTGTCTEMGEKAESSFGALLAKRGKVRPATDREQMKHIDFVLTTPDNKTIKYEVKSRKRINRGDSIVNDKQAWIEWTNVIGNSGWIEGSSDYLVFEREKDFLIVGREKLKQLCLKLCDLTSLVPYASQALYRAYQRQGRKDVVSLVKMSDIESVAEEVWAK